MHVQSWGCRRYLSMGRTAQLELNVQTFNSEGRSGVEMELGAGDRTADEIVKGGKEEGRKAGREPKKDLGG